MDSLNFKFRNLDDFLLLHSPSSRDGRKELIHPDKFKARLKRLCYGFRPENCNFLLVFNKVLDEIFDGISTTQLDKLAAETAAGMCRIHPDYSLLAARIAVSNLHKNTTKSFSETIKILHNHVDEDSKLKAPLVGDDVYEFIIKNARRLDGELIYDRDYDCDYHGMKATESAYLLKIYGKLSERPQHMLMRLAVETNKNDIDSAINTYHSTSKQWFIQVSQAIAADGASPMDSKRM